jgi:hypothetical protein
MRAALVLGIPFVVVGLFSAGCFDLTQSSDADAGTDTSGTSTADAAAAVTGGGCGVEENTGTELCRAVSECPNVVVDTEAMPHCGFRIRGTVIDIVCGCGTAICPMGTFANCTEAAQLLTSQTEQGVCVQLGEDRCVESTSSSSTSTTGSSTTTTSGNPACDTQCVKDCGGGSACASVCNCN